MKKTEFGAVREYLGKTQNQMAQVLDVSSKAVQSYEQGWRQIPTHVERQTLLLLALTKGASEKRKPCWAVRKCPTENRQSCPAWQLKAGHLCWFINGTICAGSPRRSWKEKMKICRECKVYRVIFAEP